MMNKLERREGKVREGDGKGNGKGKVGRVKGEKGKGEEKRGFNKA